MVGAVGDHIEHIDILHILAFSEARILKQDAEIGIGVTAVQIPERQSLDIIRTIKRLLQNIVQLIVVVCAYIIEQSHLTLIFGNLLRIESNDIQVFDGVFI